jgi:hypothetical protein
MISFQQQINILYIYNGINFASQIGSLLFFLIAIAFTSPYSLSLHLNSTFIDVTICSKKNKPKPRPKNETAVSVMVLVEICWVK